MSGVRVRVGKQHLGRLVDVLAEPEQVAFAYATFSAATFEIVELDVIATEEVEFRSDWHVTLADEVRPRLIKAAWDTGRCLIESHSHGPHGSAQFSPSDLAGFEEWVRHVRWRLRGRPYAALVLAGDTWDALAWTEGTEPTGVAGIDVTDRGAIVKTITPTNATANTLAQRSRHDPRSQ
jgi:hypothetical protein